MTTTTITPLASYRNELAYPFCPGCGHSPILDALNAALVRRGTDPARVVIVSDIGCSGLSDQYFVTSAFHGLHGRSITYATGIKLARPDLDVIVVMGDGGTGIGGAHLLNAARRNIGITLLLFNNFNFGMTGGQHSTTTPAGSLTATTPGGHLERPLDVCATVAVNGAGYVWRGTSFDADLPDRIADAMGSGGFALLDIWELCTAYFVRSNKYTRRAFQATLDELGWPTGLIQHRPELPEYAAAYRAAPKPTRSSVGIAPIPVTHQAALDRRYSLLVAGSAGGRVRSGVRLTAQAAIRSGLYAAQADDYPITVRSGHSLSTLVLSPEPLDFAGVTVPDALVVLSEDGLAKSRPLLPLMAPESTVMAFPEVAALETPGRLLVLDPAAAGARLARADHGLAACAAAVAVLGLFPTDALVEAAAAGGRLAEELGKVVAAGLEMAAAVR
jgi:pyruvate/2-oxoacid:ferredoxin oxidoreductase beta subunit/Pyruvate/2-oxoacid:ferredoxin oxidoreductase gamma subunit